MSLSNLDAGKGLSARHRYEANATQDNQGTSILGERYRRMPVGHLASGARVAHLFWPARILALNRGVINGY